jgi:hypothetical protein
MKVEILRNTVAGGIPVFIGEVVDLIQPEAQVLIRMKKAKEVSQAAIEEPQPKVLEKVSPVEVKAPAGEPKPKPSKRGRPKKKTLK